MFPTARFLFTAAEAAVKHVLALLRRIINGGERSLISPLPFKISMPSVDNIKTENLTQEQLQQLLEVLETFPDRAAANMMLAALYTGIRRGKIFKLKWEDIDFQRGFIKISEPKGAKSQTIPMNSQTRALFESIPEISEYLFPSRTGGPRVAANKPFNAIKKQAGLLENFRPMHGLRHLYATMIVSRGKVACKSS